MKFYVEEKRTRDHGKIYLFCCPSLFTEWEGSFWALWRLFLSKSTITQDTHKSTNLKQEIGDGTWVLYEIGLIIEKGEQTFCTFKLQLLEECQYLEETKMFA